MKYILKTTYPCLIKTENESVELEENDTLEIEDENHIYIYPQNSYQPPFCINLLVREDCFLYSFCKYNEKTFIILERKNLVFVENKETLNFSGKICKILINKNEITFENDSKIVKCINASKIKEYKVFKVNNFACVQLEKDFYAFSMKNNKLNHFSGDEIKFDNNTLHISKKTSLLDGEQKSMTVKLEENPIVETQSVKTIIDSPKELLSFQFLNCIKNKNFVSALQFLNDDLKSKIDEKKLQSFFGNVQDLLPLENNEFITISNTAKKYVTIDVFQDKISDISLDDL